MLSEKASSGGILTGLKIDVISANVWALLSVVESSDFVESIRKRGKMGGVMGRCRVERGGDSSRSDRKQLSGSCSMLLLANGLDLIKSNAACLVGAVISRRRFLVDGQHDAS